MIPASLPIQQIRGKLVVPARHVGGKTVVTVQEENGRVRKIAGKQIGGSRYETMYGWTSDRPEFGGLEVFGGVVGSLTWGFLV